MLSHRTLVLPFLLLTASALPAQSNLRPAPSGRGVSEVTLRAPDGQQAQSAPPLVIRVDYGQPHLRGRKLHTDSLVPYGKPWRTGANDPTTLRTDVDLVLGGAAIPKGTYFIMTLPGPDEWKLLVQKSGGQPGAYDPANDVARIDLRKQTLSAPLESLTMWLIPSNAPDGPGRGELRLAWGTTMLSTDWSIK
jgi:hypothetical protein